ncbi:hypothetical protein [Paraclostridium bifermentans]|uniref:hypothetical protein n=1 Tax=Paraclostridium bifermentans TaxID=1490 RepID=UPI00243059BF|nr:hypothetical protein [Paraclostridium bifermentans]
MLKINKTINISGTSSIDGQIVVYMNANLSTDGNTNESIGKNIENQTLYDDNKSAIRQEMKEFEELVYAEQDSISAEVKEGK